MLDGLCGTCVFGSGPSLILCVLLSCFWSLEDAGGSGMCDSSAVDLFFFIVITVVKGSKMAWCLCLVQSRFVTAEPPSFYFGCSEFWFMGIDKGRARPLSSSV